MRGKKKLKKIKAVHLTQASKETEQRNRGTEVSVETYFIRSVMIRYNCLRSHGWDERSAQRRSRKKKASLSSLLLGGVAFGFKRELATAKRKWLMLKSKEGKQESPHSNLELAIQKNKNWKWKKRKRQGGLSELDDYGGSEMFGWPYLYEFCDCYSKKTTH